MFKSKSLSLTIFAKEMFEMLSKLTHNFLLDKKVRNQDHLLIADEIIEYIKYKVVDIFKYDGDLEVSFKYNISKIKKINKNSDFNEIKFKNKRSVLFVNQGKKEISKYTKIFGSDINGLSRILSRVYLKKLFRTPKYLD